MNMTSDCEKCFGLKQKEPLISPQITSANNYKSESFSIFHEEYEFLFEHLMKNILFYKNRISNPFDFGPNHFYNQGSIFYYSMVYHFSLPCNPYDSSSFVAFPNARSSRQLMVSCGVVFNVTKVTEMKSSDIIKSNSTWKEQKCFQK